jgi:DivIVA domain-containing protein
MPLTPADVHNVAFSKPPIGKRGYNEDEVDAFLDLVEAELARLIEENNDLRTQVEQLEQRLVGAQAELDDTRGHMVTGVSGPVPIPVRPVIEEQRPLTPVPPPSAMEMTSPGGDHHVQAAKVLGLAQEMADGMLGEARAKSEQLLSEARAKSDSMVNEARSRAETMLNDARTRAETLERQAREKAGSLERDAQRKHTEILGAIQQEKTTLEKKIDELRTFEREYRTRLKTYLESQLRDLEGRGSAAPADTGRNAQQAFATSFGRTAEAG